MPPSTQPALPDDEVSKSSSSKPQSAATYTQSRNRVDLILGASHKSILSSLRAGHASPQPPASPASKTATVGFSALRGGSSATHSNSNNNGGGTNTPASAATALQDELEQEIASLRNTSANAGLGFAASRQAEKTGPASAAQNAVLRRRMGLGRSGRGAGDTTNGAAARRRAREESSSDEEEGRSALGRRKFKRARAHQNSDEAEDRATVGTGAQATTSLNGETAPPAGADDGPDEPPQEMVTEAGNGIDTPEVQQAEGLPAGGPAQKRKKKKKKNKQKMA